MFQNEMIAKRAGQAAESAALIEGYSLNEAAELNATVTAAKLAELDAWVLANVGLD